MALTLGRVFVELGLKKTKDFKRAPDDIRKLGRSAKQSAGGVSNLRAAFAGLGGVLAAIGLTKLIRGLTDFVRQSTSVAAAAQEIQNRFEVSFGSMINEAEAWAKSISEATGLNDTTFKNFSSTLQDIALGMGLPQDAAFDLSTSLSELAVDLSSFKDIPFEQAFNALRSGIVGETEPLKNLGIITTENVLSQTDFAKSIGKTAGEMTQQEKVFARQEAIMTGARNSIGDFIDTQDSFSNQTKILGETWTKLQETFGEFIAQNPAVAQSMKLLNDLMKSISVSLVENKERWTQVVSGAIFFFLEGIAATLDLGGTLLTWFAKAGVAIEKVKLKLLELVKFVFENVTILNKFIPGLKDLRSAQLGVIETGIMFAKNNIAIGEGLITAGEKGQEWAAGLRKVTGEMVNNTKGAKSAADQTTRMASAVGGAANDTNKLTKAQKALNKELAKMNESLTTKGLVKEMDKMVMVLLKMAENGERLSKQGLKQVVDLMDELKDEGLAIPPILQIMADDFQNNGFAMIEVSKRSFELSGGLNRISASAKAGKPPVDKLAEANKAFAQSMAEAADFAQIFGGRLGSLVTGFTTFAAGAKRLFGGKGIMGNLKDTFKGASDAAGGGFLGGLAGASSLAGPLASLAEPIFNGLKSVLGGLFGKSDLVKDASRDLGANISRELADSLRKEGKPIQLALADIFKEGGFESVDVFAREVGDILSGFSRGDFGQAETMNALKESIPILVENFGNLGEAGQMEVQRIITAAKEMGLEFEGLQELIQVSITEETLEQMGLVGETNVHRIRAAAEELGVEFGFLKELIDQTFAPETLEGIAEKFGLTTEEARALAEQLGINVQTNLERVAASLGLTASEFQALGAALEKEFGIPAEQLAEFLEATGLSAADLAEQLGVEVGEGAKTAAENSKELADNMNDEVVPGIDNAVAGALALEAALRGAASAASGINVPGSGDLEVNNPTINRASGTPFTAFRETFVRVGETGPERVNFDKDGQGNSSGGGSDQPIVIEVVMDGEVVARKAVPHLERMTKNREMRNHVASLQDF